MAVLFPDSCFQTVIDTTVRNMCSNFPFTCIDKDRDDYGSDCSPHVRLQLSCAKDGMVLWLHSCAAYLLPI